VVKGKFYRKIGGLATAYPAAAASTEALNHRGQEGAQGRHLNQVAMGLLHRHHNFSERLIRFQALMGLSDFGQRENTIDIGAKNAVSE
jgi:hypothetical protein